MEVSETDDFELIEDDASVIGTVVAGRYRVERLIGEGGFASVYLASHTEVASLKVAVKILHNSYQADEKMVERFRHEAQLLAMLRNRHTVRLLDFGFTEKGRAYLAMDFVEGQSLDIISHRQGPMAVADVVRVGVGVLKSLVEAHALGVIHRDLKPANILLVREPAEKHASPRVLDFGIAKFVEEKEGPAFPIQLKQNQTNAGLVYCTPMYASPELLRGRPDFRSDIYALGLVLAEILEGVPPYGTKAVTVRSSPHLTRTPIPFGPRCVQSPLAPILERACAKDLRDRFRSAEEMLVEMETLLDFVTESGDSVPLELPLPIFEPPEEIRAKHTSHVLTIRDSQFVLAVLHPQTDLRPDTDPQDENWEILTEDQLFEMQGISLPNATARAVWGSSTRAPKRAVKVRHENIAASDSGGSGALRPVRRQPLDSAAPAAAAARSGTPVGSVRSSGPLMTPESGLITVPELAPVTGNLRAAAQSVLRRPVPVTPVGAAIVVLAVLIPMIISVWAVLKFTDHNHGAPPVIRLEQP